MPNPYTSAKLFSFIEELSINNNRMWFEENKNRYEDDVRTPLLSFIADFEVYLKQLSPHFNAEAKKVGGSLFRIFRDVRFSKDKTPYKTNAGVHFRHERAENAHAPGYYLHLDPMESFIGVGIWRPDTATARAIRAGITEKPDAWLEATREFGKFALGGDSLKRAPPVVEADHPCIVDIMRKDWIGIVKVDRATLCSKNFMKGFAKTCAVATPFMRFLTEAQVLRF